MQEEMEKNSKQNVKGVKIPGSVCPLISYKLYTILTAQLKLWSITVTEYTLHIHYIQSWCKLHKILVFSFLCITYTNETVSDVLFK